MYRTRVRTAAILSLAALALCSTGASAAPATALAPGAQLDSPVIAILCYHDISNDPGTRRDTVSPELLRSHIRSLRDQGFHFATASQLLAFRDRPEALPEKVAVLTFDDGYRSFYDSVLPILEAEKVPATLAIVTSFIDTPPADMPPLLTWTQIRELAHSGWVEIASHTRALHRYTVANPQGLESPAVTTRLYLQDQARYENRLEYRRRIADDLQASREILERNTGLPVRVLAWPFGEHNRVAREMAAEAGFQLTLGLEGGTARASQIAAGYLPRTLVYRGLQVAELAPSWLETEPRPVLAAEVNLDDIFDADSTRLIANVEKTIQNLWSIGATHVFLQACADPDGDGYLQTAYFMNHQIPIESDIWSMTAIRMKRAGFEVWIRAPSLNLPWVWDRNPRWRVRAEHARGLAQPSSWYFRVSPDVPGVRQAAIDFYNDLAVYLPIDGVLFDDDAFLSTAERLHGDSGPDLGHKTAAIEEFLAELKNTVLAWRPGCKFGRIVHADLLDVDGPHLQFAQDLGTCLRDYDLTVVLAVDPRDTNHRFVEDLVRRSLRSPAWKRLEGFHPEKLVLALPTRSPWGAGRIDTAELQQWVVTARRTGAVSLGVFPVGPTSDLPRGLLSQEPTLASTGARVIKR